MKNALLAIPIVLCVIFIFVPLFELIDLFVQTDFSLYSELLIGIIQAVISGAALGAFYYFKPDFDDTVGEYFAVWALPVSMLNAFCFLAKGLSFAWIPAIIASVCVFIIYLKFIRDSKARAISAVFSVLLAFIIGFTVIWNLVFPIFSSKTVLRDIPSDNGEYIASICTEKSLFGTNTVIEVRKNEPEFGAIIGGYFKKPLRVYEGEEYIALNAKVSWNESKEDVLIINSAEYPIIFD